MAKRSAISGELNPAWTRFLIALAVLLVAAAPATTGHAAATAPDALPAPPPYAWRTEPIAAFADPATTTSIAMDANGTPFISYVDGTNGTVEVAHRTVGGWTSERVDGPGTFTGNTNLVVGTDGRLRLSYFDAAAKAVKYAVRGPSGWQASVVDSAIEDGYNRIALDSLNRPALVYVSFNGWLRYAAWNGTAWARETVDNATILSRYPDVTLDAAGLPRISYYGDGVLRYAMKVAGAWVWEVVDPSPYAGWFSRIRLDRDGVPHIAYYDSTNGTLRWATRLGGTWTHTVIDGANDSGWDISLAVDAFGRNQIAYYSRLLGSLRYAINTTTGWVLETAVPGGVTGWYTGIATDPSGLPHISYYDWAASRLEYAEGWVGLEARTLGVERAGSGATLRGELVALGNHSSATAGFLLRVAGTSSWAYLPHANLTSAGAFSVVVTNLTAGLVYEYRAQVTAGNETSLGDVQSFTVGVPPPPSPYGPIFYAIVAFAIAAAIVAAYLLRKKRADRDTPP